MEDMKLLKKIDKRLIRKGKSCVWNIYKQFGKDIDKLKDDPKNPLYSRCTWTEQQEEEMKRLFKKKKVRCLSIKKYKCLTRGCWNVLSYFPITKDKEE